jgi:hypothetical protein
MVWYAEFGSVFWITVGTLLTGSIALCIKYSLKSKCDTVKCCWGGLEIHRSVELEIPDIQTPTYETRDDII